MMVLGGAPGEVLWLEGAETLVVEEVVDLEFAGGAD